MNAEIPPCPFHFQAQSLMGEKEDTVRTGQGGVRGGVAGGVADSPEGSLGGSL